MDLRLISQVLWFAAPVIAAGLIHIGVIKAGLLPALARIPLDGGATLRQRRILGANKSLRGALVMPAATIGCTLLQAALVEEFSWARELSFVDFHRVSPLVWGTLLGVGYVVGELPNSFLKRQLDIAPGAAARGARGPVFWFLDQVDSLIGLLLFLSLVWVPPIRVVIALLALTLVVHPATSWLMVRLKLKARVG